MKNVPFIILCFLTSVIINAQTIVSTETQLRNVVLEEYTGIYCVNCPQGHVLANNLAELFPGRVTLINIHQGYYAVPKSGDPDFRTKWGDALAALFSINSYPAGTINRMLYNGKPEINRGEWLQFSKDSILNGTVSPVNIAAKTKWNESAQEMEIYVEVYFTSDVLNPPKLNIVVLENGIPGPQSGAESLPYIHNHVLRDMVTGQWGEDLTAYSKGTFFSKTYKYVTNSAWNIENCTLAIYITQSDKKNIYTGTEIPFITPNAVITTTGSMNSLASNNIPFQKIFNIKNQSDKDVTFFVNTKKTNRTPNDWSIKVNDNLTEFTLLPGNTKDIVINLEPGLTKAIGDAVIEFTEKDNTRNPVYSFQMTAVSSDVEYMEINSGGSSINSLTSVNDNFISISYDLFKELNSGMNSLKTIMWNSGTGNALETAEAELADNLLSKGIKILFNGSVAIPKLVINNPQNNLLLTLGITFTPGSDIIANTYNLYGVPLDPIGDGINITGLTRLNNGSFLEPITINNPERAFPILKSENSNKVISIRSITPNSRAIYLSFFLEAITDINVKSAFLRKCLNWLEGTTDIKEFGNNNSENLVNIYPNPAGDYIEISSFNPTLKRGVDEGYDIQIFDMLGVNVLNFKDNPTPTLPAREGVRIDVSFLSPGIYFIKIRNRVEKFVKM